MISLRGIISTEEKFVLEINYRFMSKRFLSL